MPRPRSILWVDDEVESLTSHILFLEEQGFAVETSTHGDDALVLLQRQPYGVVLLDEQMPGRRGLDLFQAIRAIDNGMPVVMVTKSEEPETLKDAIGQDISDYLIKPVNPRQILSVVTRLLEGDRIRQQRLSRDFATRFRELEARRGGPLGWREWIELVVELAEWEVRLGQADEPGLQLLVGAPRPLPQGLDLRRDVAHPRDGRLGVLAALLGRRDALRRRLLLCAQALGGRRGLAPAGVEVEKLVDVLGELGGAAGQRGADRVGIATDEPEVEHGSKAIAAGSRSPSRYGGLRTWPGRPPRPPRPSRRRCSRA